MHYKISPMLSPSTQLVPIHLIHNDIFKVHLNRSHLSLGVLIDLFPMEFRYGSLRLLNLGLLSFWILFFNKLDCESSSK